MAVNSPTRPRISLILLACNQRSSARAAAESCLGQICEPLEIVLSDDASSDGTFAELQASASAYVGPHRVRVRRNETNLGIGAHYNRLLQETGGELLVTAAADDLSTPNRVQRLADVWDASGRRLDLIASHFIDMAPDGSLGDVMETDDLAPILARKRCPSAMVDAESVAARWQAARAETRLPWPWRLRKFLTFTFPHRAACIKSGKARWRGH